MVACHLCSRKEKSAFFRLMIRTGSCYQHSFSFPIHYQSFIGVLVILSRSYSPQTKPPHTQTHSLTHPLNHSLALTTSSGQTHYHWKPNFQWISILLPSPPPPPKLSFYTSANAKATLHPSVHSTSTIAFCYSHRRSGCSCFNLFTDRHRQ